MGVSTGKYVDARHRNEPHCRHDRRETPPRLCKGRSRWVAARLSAFLIAFWLVAFPASAKDFRIATFNVELDRKGPGLLLRDILRGEDEQIEAVVQVITHTAPDILVLQKVDYDLDLRALMALRDAIAIKGPTYPHLFAQRPNAGLHTGVDLDGDGRLGDPRDAQGYGAFAGNRGMAVLSRFPIDHASAQDFSTVLWRELPGALLPERDGAPFPSPEARNIQRLSSVGHWVVPVAIENQMFDLLVFHATTPVFDGPEDRNGKRNHDELKFWQYYLDGGIGTPPQGEFALLGAANLDPVDSNGRREAMQGLLLDKRLQDPKPMRTGAAPADPSQKGDPRLDTVFWPDPGPGALRVDYVLPSAGLHVTGSGVYWPTEGTAEAEIARKASRHRLVWVDVRLEAP